MVFALPLAVGLIFNYTRPSVPVIPQRTMIVRRTYTPSPSPTPSPLTPSSDEVKSYIMSAINDYRRSQGLSEVKTDPYTCDFAKVRAEEISKSFSHSGFNARVQNKTLPYPSYSTVTENIAMNSDYKKVVSAWINSSGHAANMRANTPNVCVEKFNNFYAYEGWKP